jgi:membrane protease YdiL (CAAX protease family)
MRKNPIAAPAMMAPPEAAPGGAAGSAGTHQAAAVPSGTPYHRLARTSAHRWWRPVVGTLLMLIVWGTLAGLVALVGLLVAAGGAGGAFDKMKAAIGGEIAGAVALLSIAVAIPAVLLAARWIQKRPAGTVSSVLGRLRYGWLGRCVLLALGAAALAQAGSFALAAATGQPLFSGSHTWVGWAPFAAGMALIVVLVPFQAGAEEYVFRGWLLQAIGAFCRTPWLAVGVQAVIFAAGHGWQGWWGSASTLLFGVITGVLAVRTGGLEAAIALHIANNVVALTPLAAFGMLGTLLGTADPTTAQWSDAVTVALFYAVYTVIVLKLARRRKIATVVPETTIPAAPLPAPLPATA